MAEADTRGTVGAHLSTGASSLSPSADTFVASEVNYGMTSTSTKPHGTSEELKDKLGIQQECFAHETVIFILDCALSLVIDHAPQDKKLGRPE